MIMGKYIQLHLHYQFGCASVIDIHGRCVQKIIFNK